MKYILMLLLLVASPLAIPQSTDSKLFAIQEKLRNMDNYNAEFARKFDDTIMRIDDTRDKRFEAIYKSQGAQDEKITALEKTSIQAEAIAGAMLVLVPLALGFTYFKFERENRTSDDRRNLIESKISDLERSEAKNGERNDLLTRMGELITSTLVSDLHHDIGHDEADVYLDKIDGHNLSDEDETELKKLMKIRETDPTVTEKEQGKAKALPVILQIVKELRALPPIKGAEIPTDDVIKFFRKDEI